MAHELIGFYTIADNSGGILKVMRSYQYYAANAIADKVAKIKWDEGNQLGGYIWHTTGSGKTMTSFKSAQLIADAKEADKVIFLTDRIELGTQSLKEYRNFAEENETVQATENTYVLISKLKSTNFEDTLIVTSIQKMSNIKEEGFNVHDIQRGDVRVEGGFRMIYTVTFNPALDYVVQVDDLTLGMVNRTKEEAIYYGGKGINVSTVLKNLGIESVALGFVAGFTGDVIEKGVKELGVATDFIHLQEGMSRINVKIRSNEESEINGQGPKIGELELTKLFEQLNQLEKGDTLVLAGSIPSSLPSDIYEKIMEHLQDREIQIVVDATKDLLLNVLKYHPFLIKPNNHELEEVFQVSLKTEEDLIVYGKKLQEMGARNVLISRASKGAILIDEHQNVSKIGVPKGTVKNSVGAGDSMVAGFIAGYSESKDYQYALKLAGATGSATAFSEGLATKELVMELLKQL